MNNRVNFDHTTNTLELQWTLSSHIHNGERHTCIRLSGIPWKQAGMEIHVESVGHWCVAVRPYNHAGIILEFHEVYYTRSVPCCSAADCFLRGRSTSTGGRTDHLGHFVFEFSWCEAISSFMSYSLYFAGWRTWSVTGALSDLWNVYSTLHTDLYLSSFSSFLEIWHMRIAMKTIRPSVGTWTKLPKQTNN